MANVEPDLAQAAALLRDLLDSIKQGRARRQHAARGALCVGWKGRRDRQEQRSGLPSGKRFGLSQTGWLMGWSVAALPGGAPRSSPPSAIDDRPPPESAPTFPKSSGAQHRVA
jgi:hypothetical protein